jgi:hypothetical protein
VASRVAERLHRENFILIQRYKKKNKVKVLMLNMRRPKHTLSQRRKKNSMS